MSDALVITAVGTMTNPLPNTPRLYLSGDQIVVTSDTFTGPASPLAGRTSDKRLGGSALPWINLGDPVLQVNGSGRVDAAPSVSGTFFYHFDIADAPKKEVEIGIRMTAKFTSNIFLDLFRSNETGQRLRATLTPSGGGSMVVRGASSSASEAVPGAEFSYAPGDAVRVSYNPQTGRIQVHINKVRVVSVDSFFPASTDWAPGTKFGVAGTASTSGSIDDFVLIEIVP